jgi:mannose-6-phosphate isomerase-like protein (cupin superfamily)
MNDESIVAELGVLYPGKPIKRLPADAPTQIVCEFDPMDTHPEWSRAVAIIDRSLPHYHKKIVKIYHVVKGTLTLHVDDQEFMVYEGQEFTITPGQVHWAIGNETWVEVYCTPGYSSDDHFLVEP